MKVFLHSGGAAAPLHVMHVAPGADAADRDTPVPPSWLNDDGDPITFGLRFERGVCEVPADIGGYLVMRGLAHRKPLRKGTCR